MGSDYLLLIRFYTPTKSAWFELYSSRSHCLYAHKKQWDRFRTLMRIILRASKHLSDCTHKAGESDCLWWLFVFLWRWYVCVCDVCFIFIHFAFFRIKDRNIHCIVAEAHTHANWNQTDTRKHQFYSNAHWNDLRESISILIWSRFACLDAQIIHTPISEAINSWWNHSNIYAFG